MPQDKKKRRINKFSLNEISIVGKPAQESALIAITKSASDSNGDDSMSKELEAKLQKSQDQINSLEILVKEQMTTIDTLNKINGLSAEVRQYYSSLDAAEQTVFISKSATQQEAEMQNAKLANSIVYKDRHGIEFRKSDDPRLVQMAKDADSQAEIIKNMEKQNEDLRIQKMVNDFKFLPGDEATRHALVKAIDGISDEALKKAAFESLKSKNDAHSQMFKTHGISGDGAAEVILKAENELDELVQKHMQTNTNLSMEAAYDAVLQTPEGAKLYDRIESRMQ